MLWYVALGGALGSVSRAVLGPALQRAFDASFPLGTLGINVLGSFAIGLAAAFIGTDAHAAPQMRAFIATGFLGGFTTFSAFSWETVHLVEQGQPGRAVAYALLSVTLSVAAAFFGLLSARGLFHQ